ncbi:hypothetical protein [Clostridium hydrogenum]|uniref:hypothetical protein n=1 Tax=Clostridium hydrogenum TaxID=2855764 RepID=UPI001F239F6C|nr:hypothetical protein [Clostridium hydrogenum]
MNKELELFLKSKAKETPYGGYTFILEGINFSVIEMPLGLSLQYYYIGIRETVEPKEIMLDKNVSLQDFSKKTIEIVEGIKNAQTLFQK